MKSIFRNETKKHYAGEKYAGIPKCVFILLILLTFFTFPIVAQNSILYHAFEQTASDYMITKWNIPKDSLSAYKWYVEETVNNDGRVIQLRFLENGNPCKERLCYLADVVKYEYPDNFHIIESEFECDGITPNGRECEENYKTIYTLDSKTHITHIEIVDFIDKDSILKTGQYSGVDNKNMKIEINNLEKQNRSSDIKDASINYYSNSFAKYNGKYPINKKQGKYWKKNTQKEEGYNKIEMDEILKCIKHNN